MDSQTLQKIKDSDSIWQTLNVELSCQRCGLCFSPTCYMNNHMRTNHKKYWKSFRQQIFRRSVSQKVKIFYISFQVSKVNRVQVNCAPVLHLGMWIAALLVVHISVFIRWKLENRSNVMTVESFFKARIGFCSICIATPWTQLGIMPFPARILQIASTKLIRKPTWMIAGGECTSQMKEQVFGCALLGLAEKSPDIF